MTTPSNHVVPFLPVLGTLQVFYHFATSSFYLCFLGFFVLILEDLCTFFVTIFGFPMPFLSVQYSPGCRLNRSDQVLVLNGFMKQSYWIIEIRGVGYTEYLKQIANLGQTAFVIKFI